MRRKNDDLQIWLFRCDCGNQIEAFSCDVISGAIKSCGRCGEKIDSVIDLAPFCPDCGGAITRDMRGHCH